MSKFLYCKGNQLKWCFSSWCCIPQRSDFKDVLHYHLSPQTLFILLFDKWFQIAVLGHCSQMTASEAAETVTLNNISLLLFAFLMYKVSVCSLQIFFWYKLPWHQTSVEFSIKNSCWCFLRLNSTLLASEYVLCFSIPSVFKIRGPYHLCVERPLPFKFQLKIQYSGQ